MLSDTTTSACFFLKLCSLYAFRQAYDSCQPRILEPVMKCEVRAPTEYQGDVIGGLNRKKGVINDNVQELDEAVIEAMVPLNNMFGYSTELRSITQVSNNKKEEE